MKRILKKILKVAVIILVVLGIAAGGGYAYLRYTASQQTQSTLASLQTVKLATGSISTTISATGTVRTQQTAQVSWQASGKVGAVAVMVGDQVKVDDLLASLDASSLPTSIIAAQQDLVTAQQALADLKNNKSDLPTAQLAVITAQTAVDSAQKARNYLNYPRGSVSQIAAAEASYLLAQQKVNQLQSIYNKTPGNDTTDAPKALALSNLAAAKTARDSAEYNMEWIKGDATASEIATADTNLALAKAKLADAQAALEKLQNGPDASSIASAEQRIAADQATIKSQSVYAPFDGTITSVSVMTGDMVSSGTISFRIDDTSAYYIDLSVSEVDIAKVQADQPVTIAFDAISDKTYNGKVTKVGQVGTTSNSVVNFTVTVQITDADASIKPGMTASSDVVVSSVSDVMVVSTKAIKTVNNQKYVYILTTTNSAAPVSSANNTNPGTTSSGSTANNASSANPPAAAATVQQIVPVKVEVGASNDTQTQITSSQLKVGDLLITNPPSSTTATTTLSSSQNSLGLGGLLGGLLGGGGATGGGPSGPGGGSPPSGSPPSGGGAPPSSGGGAAPSGG